jgi:hypothetical protein
MRKNPRRLYRTHASRALLGSRAAATAAILGLAVDGVLTLSVSAWAIVSAYARARIVRPWESVTGSCPSRSRTAAIGAAGP